MMIGLRKSHMQEVKKCRVVGYRLWFYSLFSQLLAYSVAGFGSLEYTTTSSTPIVELMDSCSPKFR
jgi:hypothetical protein